MENVTETHRPKTDWQQLPILITNERGKHLSPLEPHWENLEERLYGDIYTYSNQIEENRNGRGLLIIEESEESTLDDIFVNMTNIIQDSMKGKLPTNEDLKDVATYLDWSYQQQVGIPASSSNYNTAKSNCVGARDVWKLFTSIKNKLENEN